jgi:hypothetical protein
MRPGSRAPHAWLDGGSRSTLDAYGQGFVLMDFGTGCEPLFRAARERGLPLRRVAGDASIAGVYERKLVLVRPDGHVAWRGDEVPADPLALVDRVRGA